MRIVRQRRARHCLPTERENALSHIELIAHITGPNRVQVMPAMSGRQWTVQDLERLDNDRAKYGLPSGYFRLAGKGGGVEFVLGMLFGQLERDPFYRALHRAMQPFFTTVRLSYQIDGKTQTIETCQEAS
jgi:hypothetical protein